MTGSPGASRMRLNAMTITQNETATALKARIPARRRMRRPLRSGRSDESLSMGIVLFGQGVTRARIGERVDAQDRGSGGLASVDGQSRRGPHEKIFTRCDGFDDTPRVPDPAQGELRRERDVGGVLDCQKLELAQKVFDLRRVAR